MDELHMSAASLNAAQILPKARMRTYSHFFEGWGVYLQGILAWRIWVTMAVSEIRRRYRRTLLGPFWVTLSIAIFIGCIGVIFPKLWHTDIKTYLPFFSSGYIIWIFVSSIITEGCGTFIDCVGLLKQTTLPYSVYANNVVARNLLVLFHHLVVYVIIMLCFSVPITLSTLLLIPGLVILSMTGSWFCLLLGLFASRFRDVKQLVTSLLQISMFVTPIFWSPSQLVAGSSVQFWIAANPLYHFIQIVRMPLLGQQPTLMDWGMTIGICFIGWIITLHLLGKYKRHLIFWL